MLTHETKFPDGYGLVVGSPEQRHRLANIARFWAAESGGEGRVPGRFLLMGRRKGAGPAGPPATSDPSDRR